MRSVEKNVVLKMKKRITLFSALLIFTLSTGIKGFSQNNFVLFETTKNTNIVCQDKTLGVIATLMPDYEGNTNFRWEGDSENFREVKDEIAIVNTSTPGEKKLKFTLTIDEKHKLDTVFIASVLPKPDVSLLYSDGKLSFTDKENQNIASFKWIYNKALLPQNTERTIKNPNKGSYRVIVTDNNGCFATSQEVIIE